MKKVALLLILLACSPSLPNNSIGLDTVWITWNDSHQTSRYVGYSSGHKRDSVLHVSGHLRFWKPAGDSYDRFIVPDYMDSIIHVDRDSLISILNGYVSLDISEIYEERFIPFKGKQKWHAGYISKDWRKDKIQ